MSGFLLGAAVLLLAALAFVLPPLLRGLRSRRPDADAANLAIYRHQLAELDADLVARTIGSEEHRRARAELEARLLADVAGSTDAGAGREVRSPGAAIALGVSLPLVATLLYFAIGNPQALDPASHVAADRHAASAEQIAAMVEKLTARLKDKPDDLTGWLMLGRSYKVLGRVDAAVAAYREALTHVKPNADFYADFAEAIGYTREGNLAGEPLELLYLALNADPHHVKALALTGSGEIARGDLAKAVAHWERLLGLVPPDSELARAVSAKLAELRASGSRRNDSAGAALLAGTVSLSPAVAAKASPDDTVFVFARPADGSRAPLAVVRARVRDLPMEFRFDDSMSMTADRRLSQAGRVVVMARVSKSGGAMPQSGDVEGVSVPVDVGGSGITVLIDRIVP